MGIRKLWRRFFGRPIKEPVKETAQSNLTPLHSIGPEERALVEYVKAHPHETGSYQHFQYNANTSITENPELWGRIRDFVKAEYPYHRNPMIVSVDIRLGHAWVWSNDPRPSYSEKQEPPKKAKPTKSSSGDDVIYSGGSAAQTAIDIAIDMSI